METLTDRKKYKQTELIHSDKQAPEAIQEPTESYLLYQEGLASLQDGSWEGLEKAREKFKKAYKSAYDADDYIEEDIDRALGALKKMAHKSLAWKPERYPSKEELEEYREEEARKAYNFLELYDLL